MRTKAGKLLKDTTEMEEAYTRGARNIGKGKVLTKFRSHKLSWQAMQPKLQVYGATAVVRARK